MKGQTHAQVAARDRAMVDAFRSGTPIDELVRLNGVKRQTVVLALKRAGLDTKKPKKVKPPKIPRCPKPPKPRDLEMASMYRQGLTLAIIGEKFGLTRERVRQLVSKQGITRLEGGISCVHAQKVERANTEAEARYQLKYGFSRAEMADFRKRRVTHAYSQQKKNSAERGIAFRLTFKQWVAIWEASGKYDQRGRGIGRYVMSRIKDEGCYELGNVHIQLSTENNSDARKRCQAVGPKNTYRGIYQLTPGAERPWHARYGRTEIGRFFTEQEAFQARTSFLANRTGA